MIRTIANPVATTVDVRCSDASAVVVAVVRLGGDVDDVGAAAVHRAIGELLAGSPPARLELDLGGVTALPAAGLTMLLALHRDCRRTGTRLVLARAGHPAVHVPLRLSGLLPLFETRRYASVTN